MKKEKVKQQQKNERTFLFLGRDRLCNFYETKKRSDSNKIINGIHNLH